MNQCAPCKGVNGDFELSNIWAFLPPLSLPTVHAMWRDARHLTFRDRLLMCCRDVPRVSELSRNSGALRKILPLNNTSAAGMQGLPVLEIAPEMML